MYIPMLFPVLHWFLFAWNLFWMKVCTNLWHLTITDSSPGNFPTERKKCCNCHTKFSMLLIQNLLALCTIHWHKLSLKQISCKMDNFWTSTHWDAGADVHHHNCRLHKKCKLIGRSWHTHHSGSAPIGPVQSSIHPIANYVSSAAPWHVLPTWPNAKGLLVFRRTARHVHVSPHPKNKKKRTTDMPHTCTIHSVSTYKPGIHCLDCFRDIVACFWFHIPVTSHVQALKPDPIFKLNNTIPKFPYFSTTFHVCPLLFHP